MDKRKPLLFGVLCLISGGYFAFYARDDFYRGKTATSKRMSSFFNLTQIIKISQRIQWTIPPPSSPRNRQGENCSTQLPSNLTIVTAYWNIGTFRKGSGNSHFSTKTYFNWATVFKYLVNPLVVYTDSVEFKELMERLRSERINHTAIYLVNRTDFWSFKLLDDIRSVYKAPGYPQIQPNTVVPEYTATQHAKYAAMADAVRKQIFRNPYYAWLDIGYFRDVVERNVKFELKIPPGFDSSRISFNCISKASMSVDPYTIFRSTLLWVGGGMFLGTGEVLLKFEQLYHKAVLYFLDQKLMNSDQQLLYSVYSDKGREALKPKVELQLYIPQGSGNPWFYLGYLCRKEITMIKRL